MGGRGSCRANGAKVRQEPRFRKRFSSLKSFDRLSDAAESLDDFRYKKTVLSWKDELVELAAHARQTIRTINKSTFMSH